MFLVFIYFVCVSLTIIAVYVLMFLFKPGLTRFANPKLPNSNSKPLQTSSYFSDLYGQEYFCTFKNSEKSNVNLFYGPKEFFRSLKSFAYGPKTNFTSVQFGKH